MAHKILIVEDEPEIRELLSFTLSREGYDVLEAETAEAALLKMDSRMPDLAVVDWMLPGMDGVELARRIRRDEVGSDLPIIMLTARGDEPDKLKSFASGVDDYITKPFAPKELVARMKAILRRSSSQEAGGELRVGELVLEIDSRRVMLRHKALEMGPTEFKLLHFFMAHPERAYSRAQLLDRVWGANVYVEERTVDVHIRRLRKALQAGDPIYADLIQTVRGTGYRFSPRDLAVA